MAIIIGDRIQNNATDSTLNPVPNLDLYYGPYDNIEEALKFLPQKVRSIGLTVGIKRKGVINEYWFKEGIQNTDLVVKQLDFTYQINQLGSSIQTAKEHLDDFKVATAQKNTELDNKINSSILDVKNKLSTLETGLEQGDTRVDDKIDGVQDQIRNLSQMTTRKSYTSQSTMNEDGVAPIGDDGTLILLGQLVILNDTTTPENNGLYRFTNPGWAFVGNLGNLEPYALKGGSSKTLKEVEDEVVQLAGDVNLKAEHGYAEGEQKKSLKEVEVISKSGGEIIADIVLSGARTATPLSVTPEGVFYCPNHGLRGGTWSVTHFPNGISEAFPQKFLWENYTYLQKKLVTIIDEDHFSVDGVSNLSLIETTDVSKWHFQEDLHFDIMNIEAQVLEIEILGCGQAGYIVPTTIPAIYNTESQQYRNDGSTHYMNSGMVFSNITSYFKTILDCRKGMLATFEQIRVSTRDRVVNRVDVVSTPKTYAWFNFINGDLPLTINRVTSNTGFGFKNGTRIILKKLA